jgi:hypothetical protein
MDSTGRLGFQKDVYVVAKSYEAARKIRNIDTFDIVRITADKIHGDFKLDLSDASSPDDTAMILVNTSGQRLKRIVTDYIDVKWFGAQGDGVTDDWYNLQRAIDWTIYHNLYPRKLVFSGAGTTYISSKGLFVGRIVTSDHYGFFSINITGDPVGCSYFGMESYVTQVTFTNPNEFGFGFQFCRASTIEGLIINGAYHCPVNFSPDGKAFYRTKYTDFYDGVCRTDRFSPHVGICTDPLTVNGTIPPGGGYSRFSSYYTNYVNGGGGCSGLTVRDVSIRNFVVCFGASINGTSANSENVQLETVEFRECIVGYSSGQSQEKENSAKHITCWWPVHTVFDNLNFGSGSGICPNIDGVNIAGYCIRAFNVNNSGYYSSSINNVFAESILQIGNLSAQTNITIQNSTFDLLTNDNTWPNPEWVVSCQNTTFLNCLIRRYDGVHERWPISSINTSFIGCSFGGVPILLNNEYRTAAAAGIIFSNCNVNIASGMIISNGGVYGIPGSNVYTDFFLPHGKSTIRYGEEIQLRYDDAKFFRLQSDVETVTINTDTVRNVAKFYTPNTSRYQVGDVILNSSNTVIYSDNAVGDNQGGGPQWLGIVDSVLTDTIKLRAINRELPNGNSSKLIAFDRVVYAGKLFTGDVTSGSKVITNVVPYDVNNWPAVGYTMDWPVGSSNNTVYVTAVDSSAKTITVNWVSAFTQKGVRFFNGNPQVIRNKSATYYNTNTNLFTGPLSVDDEISADVTSAANGNVSIKPTFKILTSGYKTPTGTQKKAIIKNTYGKSVVDTAGNYSALGIEDVVNVNATSANATVTLFPSTDNQYLAKDIMIKKIDSSIHTVTVVASGSDSLDGSTSVVLSNVYDWVWLINRGNGKFGVYKPGAGGSGAVSSVSNSDGSITLSPTTGSVVGSLNLGHSNTWTAAQTINNQLTIANSGNIGININSTNTSDGGYPINFNRSSQSVQNAFNWQTAGVDKWFYGVNNDGTDNRIDFSWTSNKLISTEYDATGDLALGNSQSALYLRQGDQSIGFNSTSPSFGHYINRRIGVNKDSLITISSISTGMLMVVDTGAGGIYKMLPSDLVINSIYTADGSLAGNRILSGASNSLQFGSGASPLSAFGITSSGRFSIFAGITYDVDANNTDANYTVAANTIIAEVSDVLTTNRTLTLPSAVINGQSITLLMRYSSGSNKYSLSSAVTDNATGTTFTTLDWGKTYDFMVDQSLVWRLIRKY